MYGKAACPVPRGTGDQLGYGGDIVAPSRKQVVTEKTNFFLQSGKAPVYSKNIRLYKFIEGLYQQFRQIVLFGVSKKSPSSEESIYEYLKDAGAGKIPIPYLPETPERSRPGSFMTSGGRPSGTWCGQAFRKGWLWSSQVTNRGAFLTGITLSTTRT